MGSKLNLMINHIIGVCSYKLSLYIDSIVETYLNNGELFLKFVISKIQTILYITN